MNFSIKNLIAAAVTIVFLSGSAFASDNIANVKNVTSLTTIKNYNKINVSGNVELILVQSAEESVKVYDNYYAKNAVVQQKNNELFISSFDKEKLTVVAYVKNLTAVTASGEARVTTFNKLNTISLNIKLQNTASADLNLNTALLNTNIDDNSNLILAGSTSELTANIGQVAKINMDKLTSEFTNVSSKNVKIAKVEFEDPIFQMLGK